MRISRRRIKFYSVVLLNYLLIIGLASIVMYNEGNIQVIDGEGISSNSMSLTALILYVVYKYIINFPTGAYNWFYDEHLLSTIIFALPNSIIISWVTLRLFPHKRKRIYTYLGYSALLITTLILFYSISHLLSGNISTLI